MTRSRFHSITGLLSPAVFAAYFFALPAHADEYSEVTGQLAQGKTAQALVLADRYIASKPRDPQMRFLRGVILNRLDRRADALAAFTKLTQEYPELPEPYNNIAAIEAAEGQFARARDALETAVRLNPGYATAHENLGDIYARLALSSWRQAQKLEASNVSVLPKLKAVDALFQTPASAEPKPEKDTQMRLLNQRQQ